MTQPEQPLPNMCGQSITDDAGRRFELAELIGQGGFGSVYKARDVSDSVSQSHCNRPPAFYAIKVMRKQHLGTKKAEYQARELALHKLVSGHPNIVSVHSVFRSSVSAAAAASSSSSHGWPSSGYGNEEELVYMVLGFCSEGDLLKAITSKRFIAERKDEMVRDVFLQLIDAVQFCHEKEVYHRDLKPENILLSEEEDEGGKMRLRARLADFGLACKSETSRDFGCGSKRTMSPESFGTSTNRKPYSHRTNDVWSLGVILIAMITNHYPWRMALPKLDPAFTAFTRDPMWLYNNLAISEDVYRLLLRILDVDPNTRIGLDELRESVLDVAWFFPREFELQCRTGARNISATSPLRISSCEADFLLDLQPEKPQVQIWNPGVWGEKPRLPQMRKNRAMWDA